MRNSWLMFAKNKLLVRLATSAALLSLGNFFFGASPFRDIFHGKHQQFAMMARFKLTGVEQHHAPPDNREVMLKFKVAKNRALGNNVFKKRA